MKITGRDNEDFIRERLSRDDPAHPDYDERRSRERAEDEDRTDEYREQKELERKKDDLEGGDA